MTQKLNDYLTNPSKSRYKDVIHQDDLYDLVEMYTEPHRHYHNHDHLESMFNYVDTWSEYPDSQDKIMYTAIWFHDAVYDPTKSDNEEKSIDLFINSHTFQDMTVGERNIVVDMIEATKDHAKGYDQLDSVKKKYQKVFKEFLDADLWELKKKDLPLNRTVEIEMAVFKEYGFVPFNIYKKERIKILEKFKETLSLEVDDNINFLKFFRPKIALYCGSFDPIHKGHYRIIERAGEIFDKVIVARGINPTKVRDIKWAPDGKSDIKFLALQKALPYHETVFYSDYQYDLIKRLKADGYHVTLVRGLRDTLDFSYEKKNNNLNEMIGVKNELGVETVLLFSEPKYDLYSSSDIKIMLESPKAKVAYDMLHNPPKIEIEKYVD
jgi:pantetheine-phosphate adenylyltransferase